MPFDFSNTDQFTANTTPNANVVLFGMSNSTAIVPDMYTLPGVTMHLNTLTSAQITGLGAAANGTFVYNTDTSKIEIRAANLWVNVTTEDVSSTYLPLTGGTITGNLGVGGACTAGVLYVNGARGALGGFYSILDDTGIITTSSAGPTAVSIYATDIISTATSFQARSDRRLKKNISPISAESAKKFVNSVDAVSYEWRDREDSTKYGFIAQDVLRAGFTPLITGVADTSMHSDNQDGVISPDGISLSISYDSVVPILAAALRDALARIDALETRLNKEKEKVS